MKEYIKQRTLNYIFMMFNVSSPQVCINVPLYNIYYLGIKRCAHILSKTHEYLPTGKKTFFIH